MIDNPPSIPGTPIVPVNGLRRVSNAVPVGKQSDSVLPSEISDAAKATQTSNTRRLPDAGLQSLEQMLPLAILRDPALVRTEWAWRRLLVEITSVKVSPQESSSAPPEASSQTSESQSQVGGQGLGPSSAHGSSQAPQEPSSASLQVSAQQPSAEGALPVPSGSLPSQANQNSFVQPFADTSAELPVQSNVTSQDVNTSQQAQRGGVADTAAQTSQLTEPIDTGAIPLPSNEGPQRDATVQVVQTNQDFPVTVQGQASTTTKVTTADNSNGAPLNQATIEESAGNPVIMAQVQESVGTQMTSGAGASSNAQNPTTWQTAETAYSVHSGAGAITESAVGSAITIQAGTQTVQNGIQVLWNALSQLNTTATNSAKLDASQLQSSLLPFTQMTTKDMESANSLQVKKWVLSDRFVSSVREPGQPIVGGGMFVLPNGNEFARVVRWQAERKTKTSKVGGLVHQLKLQVHVGAHPVEITLTLQKPTILIHLATDSAHLRRSFETGTKTLTEVLRGTGWHVEQFSVSEMSGAQEEADS